MSQQSVNKPFTPDQSVPGALQQEAIISRMIGRIFTHTVVKVEAVYPGQTGPVGFVDVINLVMQTDGNNTPIPNQKLYRLPYFRLQGGGNAVIIDPKVGDIGLASFAMRDISSIKETKEMSAPPSRRDYDTSDGLYIGGFLNGAPSQYIHFLESGVDVVATGKITITTPDEWEVNASLVRINAPIETSSTLKAGMDITDNFITQAQTMAGMRFVYNGHTHDFGPPPDQEM